MFVVGKNFLKDTKILFQEEDADERILWEAVSEPLKDYLQQVLYMYPCNLFIRNFLLLQIIDLFLFSEPFDLRHSSV